MDFNKNKVLWLKDKYNNATAYYPLKIPSVSAVLDQIPDPSLEQFIKDVGEEKAKQIMEDAQHRGTAMHCFIEHFVKHYNKTNDVTSSLQYTLEFSQKQLLEVDKVPLEKIDKGKDLFFNFYYSNYVTLYKDLIGSELSLYSPTYYFRGKADVFYKQLGIGRVVTDFKTSSKQIENGSIKELKYKRQLGAYALALEDMFKKQNVIINKASLLIMITKSSLIQEIVVQGQDLEEQKQEFKTLVKQFHINNDQSFLING